ncbi:hypothetical protein ACFFGV_08390 [Pontibacillus salicampi]|uniref:Mas-related G-protein coupled receptor member D n=1 Tax=Pontibacillus salicampi TaxID=1449801 RepID=A0ABV6LMW2_9BACI
MEQIMFIIAIISLGLALILFIGNLLTNGLKGGVLHLKNKSTRWACGFLLLYVVTFSIFLFVAN